jgi:hypothetical protein
VVTLPDGSVVLAAGHEDGSLEIVRPAVASPAADNRHLRDRY